jgi:hypothetical protein
MLRATLQCSGGLLLVLGRTELRVSAPPATASRRCKPEVNVRAVGSGDGFTACLGDAAAPRHLDGRAAQARLSPLVDSRACWLPNARGA